MPGRDGRSPRGAPDEPLDRRADTLENSSLTQPMNLALKGQRDLFRDEYKPSIYRNNAEILAIPETESAETTRDRKTSLGRCDVDTGINSSRCSGSDQKVV